MRLPRLSIMFVFARELLSPRVLRREPEAALVMDDLDEVDAYANAGSQSGAIRATYTFNLGHASLAIQGCKRVIDLGCGPAHFLTALAELHQETEFIGLDLSESMLELARANVRRRGLVNVTFQKMDISTLEGIADQSVDGVISTFALHHLPTHQHLDHVFKNMKRVLRPNGAVFLFDFGRLKSLKTVMYFAYRDKNLPYLFTLDYERSMRAAFALHDFEDLVRKYFDQYLEVVGTYKTPMMLIVKSPDRSVPDQTIRQIRKLHQETPQPFKDDIDDLRLFFSLSKIKFDPFGSFVPGSDLVARLKMLRMMDLNVQTHIFISRTTRLTILLWMFFRLALMWGINWFQSLFSNASSKVERTKSTYVEMGRLIYRTLSRLKGPAMKMGQMFSYLPIGLPPEIASQLEPLQDSVIPLHGSVIRRIVEAELGQPIHHVFLEWRDTPLASASISQLHYARLLNGQSVVVKVKYPKMAVIVASDLKNMKMLAPFLKNKSGIENVGELLDELKTLIDDESDLQKAAAFQEEFRINFSQDKDIIIPRIYKQYSTAKVLTMDYVDGQSYSEFKRHSTQEERNKAAQIIWRFAATSINRHLLYNADPHPGNYLFIDGKVCFIDFGFTKRYTPQFMNLWKEQSLAGIANDLGRFRNANIELGYVKNENTFDHQRMLKVYREVLYESWGTNRTYKFKKELIEKEFAYLTDLLKSQRGNRMPVQFLSILRLLWGQHAILADLDAEANWHSIVYPLLEEVNPT